MIVLFSPLEKKTHTFSSPTKPVNLYLCGPTVYDHIHIGNLRSSVFFALLVKLLKLKGFPVNYWQNITDIDDKIVNKAQVSNQSEVKISAYYFAEYQNILQKMDLDLPQFAKVTDHIPQIITYISQLLQKGFAYQATDGIYFNPDKLPNYYQLTKNIAPAHFQHLGLKDGKYCCFQYTKLNALVLPKEQFWTTKKSCSHFALWKCKTTGKRWDSPWGKGRPGWHTECVVLIDLLFNGQLDVHGGGSDLIYPHHHNQMAQFLALHPQKEITQFWWHNGLVYFAKQKISKSQNLNSSLWVAKNFLQVYHPNILKLLFYFGTYHLNLDFSQNKLNQSLFFDQKIKNLLQKVQYQLILINNQVLSEFVAWDSDFWDQLLSSLTQNLNVYSVMNKISHALKKINGWLDQKKIIKATTLMQTVLKFLKLINLNYVPPKVNPKHKQMILDWQDLVTKKQFVIADQLRLQLQKAGILPIEKD